MRKDIKILRAEKGQSLTELAISLTFLFVVLAGAVDLGRAFFTYITLRDAAQEGALYASFEDNDRCNRAVSRVRTSAENPVNLSDFSSVDVTCTVIGNECAGTESIAGGEVLVTVKYNNFPITMPFLGTLIGKQALDISASSTDNILIPVCSSP